MSIAILQNAPWLNINCNTVNTSLNYWETGDITFLGTDIAGGINVPYSISNNIVTLNIAIPNTEATANGTISFDNVLPENARPPETRISGIYFCSDNSTPENSRMTYFSIGANGVITFTLTEDATNGDDYSLECIIQYSL